MSSRNHSSFLVNIPIRYIFLKINYNITKFDFEMNMINQFALILFSSFYFPSNSFFNDNELKLTLDLINEFKVTQCILSSIDKKNDLKIVSDTKKILATKVFTAYYDVKQLISHVMFTEKQNQHFTTMLLWKEKNLSYLSWLSLEFEKVYWNGCSFWRLSNSQFSSFQIHTSFVFSRFIWLVFLSNFQSIKDENLAIPYDCEFIAIQSENGSNFKLTEIYEVQKNKFLSNFGVWDYTSGLKISKKTFYERRLDMNGTIFYYDDVS